MTERAKLMLERPLQAALYYSQRLATRPSWRAAGARCLASLIGLKHPPVAEPGAGGGPLAGALRADGLALLGAMLEADQVAQVRAWLRGRHVIERSDRPRVFDPECPPPGVSTADYALRDVVTCPHVLALMNRPDVLAAVGAYFGCAPTIAAVSLRWSLPGAQQNDLQMFHRDPDDWRCVKLFVYLSDVDAGSGPHVFIRGSHREATSVRIGRLSDAEAMRRYGDATSTVLGAAGSGFLADTFGWHKGAQPLARPRLMLIVQYAIRPIWQAAEKQVPKSAPGLALPRDFDPWVNRVLIG